MPTITHNVIYLRQTLHYITFHDHIRSNVKVKLLLDFTSA